MLCNAYVLLHTNTNTTVRVIAGSVRSEATVLAAEKTCQFPYGVDLAKDNAHQGVVAVACWAKEPHLDYFPA